MFCEEEIAFKVMFSRGLLRRKNKKIKMFNFLLAIGVGILILYASFSQHHVGEVAQLVEQRTENSRVVGSIPTLATI